jgi:equilibrative nucleoside transporter 1/2/3
LGSPGAGVFLVFFVTLALFPSTTVHIVSTHRCEGKGIFYDHAFVPFQFVLFNLFDFLGRSAAGHLPPRFILPPAQLWVWAAARVVFVPLFLLCNVEGSAFPVFFPSDWWPSVFMVLFAASNGYLSSLSMMFGPAQLEHAHLAEMGGNVMVLLMTCGLSGGSLLSFLVSAVSLGKL